MTVTPEMLTAAFRENEQLQRYCSFTNEEKTDSSAVKKYVVEAVMEVLRRVHENPATRNIKLNPKRADQALVLAGGDEWQVKTLEAATRETFDDVTKGMRKVTGSPAASLKLPFDVQSSAPFIPMLYEEDPDAHAREARKEMTAHLANMK